MLVTCDEKLLIRKILIYEKKLSDVKFERLKKVLIYIKNNLIDYNNNMYLTVE